VGNLYRITVTDMMAEDDNGMLIDLAAPVEMLRQFAPAAVAAALGTPAVTDEQIDQARERLELIGFLPSEPEQPKRRRRTKAEMEAARAAESTELNHPAPEVHTDPIPVETMPDVQIEKAAYNPFGNNG
jgi:hypothetical protein